MSTVMEAVIALESISYRGESESPIYKDDYEDLITKKEILTRAKKYYLKSIITGKCKYIYAGLCLYFISVETISLKDIPELYSLEPANLTNTGHWITPTYLSKNIIHKKYLLFRRYIWICKALKLVNKKLNELINEKRDNI
jgi:hypothetical protein